MLCIYITVRYMISYTTILRSPFNPQPLQSTLITPSPLFPLLDFMTLIVLPKVVNPRLCYDCLLLSAFYFLLSVLLFSHSNIPPFLSNNNLQTS